jgi:hypothetical protein
MTIELQTYDKTLTALSPKLLNALSPKLREKVLLPPPLLQHIPHHGNHQQGCPHNCVTPGTSDNSSHTHIGAANGTMVVALGLVIRT